MRSIYDFFNVFFFRRCRKRKRVKREKPTRRALALARPARVTRPIAAVPLRHVLSLLTSFEKRLSSPSDVVS